LVLLLVESIAIIPRNDVEAVEARRWAPPRTSSKVSSS